MFFYIKCVLFVLVLSISGEISAQEKRDSVRIYFHQGKVNIDTCLLDNGNEMERFAKICSALNDSVRLIRKIQIIGGASPEGGGLLNGRLSEKRQMFNSDGDKLGYILLIVSSLLFSFFWYAARAVKRFSLDCSPIMFNRELVFSSGLFSLNNSANANSSSFFIWRRFKSISSSSFSKLLLFSKLLILLCKDLPNKGIMVYMMMIKGR